MNKLTDQQAENLFKNSIKKIFEDARNGMKEAQIAANIILTGDGKYVGLTNAMFEYFKAKNAQDKDFLE